MYFKIAVTLYVLYFVTATQSVGLNGDQLTEIGDLYNKYNNGMHNISKDDIEEIGESFGIANMSDFDYKEGESNARKLQDLVVYLANNDKNTDNIKKISMSSFEVRLHVGIFREYDLKGDRKGLLDLDDVKKVIVALDLAVWNNSISYRPAEQCILIVLKEKTKQINALEFLDRIWAVKPNRGTGVNRKQVEDLMTLHNDKTIDGHINPVGIMELFKKISIVKKDYEGQLAFGSKRNPHLEMQELLVVTAEYSLEEKVGTVYSTSSVKYVLSDFTKLDDDKDGLLTKGEVKKMTDVFTPNKKENIDSFMKKYDTNEDEHMDILEFIMALFKEKVKLNDYDEKFNNHYMRNNF